MADLMREGKNDSYPLSRFRYAAQVPGSWDPCSWAAFSSFKYRILGLAGGGDPALRRFGCETQDQIEAGGQLAPLEFLATRAGAIGGRPVSNAAGLPHSGQRSEPPRKS
jgi:hypothetical protein